MSPTYNSWASMKQRCLNPNYTAYEYYGGRGITVCSKWRHSFLAFVDDMGLRPSIEFTLDRIDKNGNYEPSNCRWADKSTQIANRRQPKLLCNYPVEELIKELNRREAQK